MAATLFCDVVETESMGLLPRNLRRADGKLTPSERARLQKSFEKAWGLALDLKNPESAPSAEKSLYDMELKELLRLREMAVLIYSDFDNAAREKLASLQNEIVAQKEYDDKTMLEAFAKIMSVFNERVATERYGRFDIPEGAPRDIFSFFDQWQDVVNDCVPLR